MTKKKNEDTKDIVEVAEEVDDLAMQDFDFDVDAMLDEAGEALVHQEEDTEDEGAGYIQDRVTLIQSNSRSHPPKLRAWTAFVGHKDEAGNQVGVYVDELNFLLIDSLTQRFGPKGRMVGGRTMWPLQEDGNRDLDATGPACRSSNGITPDTRFIGEEIFDHRTSYYNRIGFYPDGSVVDDAGHICRDCAFAQWIHPGGDVCKKTFTWVVYVIGGNGYDADGNPKPVPAGVARLQGGNTGVQLSLMGRKKGKSGSQKDGSSLAGIRSFFNHTGNRLVYRDISKPLGAAIRSRVVGVAGEGDTDGYIPTETESALDEAIASGKYTHLVLNVYTYPFAPDGRPEHVGDLTPVIYPVIMRVGENGFSIPTTIPILELGTDPLSQAEYMGYIKEYLGYAKSGMRDLLMATDATMLDNDLRLQMLEGPIVSKDNPQLPGGNDVDNVVDVPVEEM